MKDLIFEIYNKYNSYERRIIAAMVIDSIAAEEQKPVREIYKELLGVAETVEGDMGPLF